MPARPRVPSEVERQILTEAGYRCAVCGAETPLERAHIVPWHRTRGHRAEDMVCLCANCHERADKEKWGEETLRRFKETPWVMRRGSGGARLPEPTALVRIAIDIEREHFGPTEAHQLQYALAAFLGIPPESVNISSVDKGNSIYVTVVLPPESAEKLVAVYTRNPSEVVKVLSPLAPLAISELIVVEGRSEASSGDSRDALHDPQHATQATERAQAASGASLAKVAAIGMGALLGLAMLILLLHLIVAYASDAAAGALSSVAGVVLNIATAVLAAVAAAVTTYRLAKKK